MSSVWALADTTIPMQLNVSAILRFSDGTEINTIAPENIKIGLYTAEDNFVWQKTYSLSITDGLIEATLSGEGTNSNGGSVVLNESLLSMKTFRSDSRLMKTELKSLLLFFLLANPTLLKVQYPTLLTWPMIQIKLKVMQ